MISLNSALLEFGPYASKAISELARANPEILNLSIGEPAFGPPAHLLPAIGAEDLSIAAFLESAKSYEQSRGMPRLRTAIANWYLRRHGLKVDPATEILITHGGVEAVSLALIACTQPGAGVALTDPSYMLYQRAALALGRVPLTFPRAAAEYEFANLFDDGGAFGKDLGGASALIVNSPENPSGYVVDQAEWRCLLDLTRHNKAWLIHDEVYDSMAASRPHHPARCFSEAGEQVILINSVSKKFGVPGLRIGWMIAPAPLIDVASKAHDLLVLGVNGQAERIAARLLDDPHVDVWLQQQCATLTARANHAMRSLREENGFEWPQRRMGGMFLFPSVKLLYHQLASRYQHGHATIGEAVAHHLLHQHQVATVPGVVYGRETGHHIRMMLATDDRVFEQAIARLAGIGKSPR